MMNEIEINNSSCSICLVPFNERSDDVESQSNTTLTCQHKFHEQCITEWFRHSNGCPICRTVVRDGENRPLLLNQEQGDQQQHFYYQYQPPEYWHCRCFGRTCCRMASNDYTEIYKKIVWVTLAFFILLYFMVISPWKTDLNHILMAIFGASLIAYQLFYKIMYDYYRCWGFGFDGCRLRRINVPEMNV